MSGRDTSTGVHKVPSIVQMEEVECGAASLAMILAAYGCWVPLEELRVTCGVSRDGASALSIVKAARHYGLEAWGGRVEREALAATPTPCILFWQQRHFLVLEGFVGDTAVVNDPAGGRRKVSADEFASSYSGIALTFSATGDLVARPQPRTGLKGSLGDMLGGSWGAVAYVVLVGVLLAVPGLMSAVLTSLFVAGVIDNYDGPGVSAIVISGLLVVTALQLLFTSLQQSVMLRLQIKITAEQTSRFVDHLMRLPLSYFDARQPGSLVQKALMNQQLAQLLAGQLGAVFANSIAVAVYGVAMLLLSPPLALVGFLMAAINLLALWWVSRRQSVENIGLQAAQVRQSGEAFVGLSLIHSIKATGSENEFFSRWAGAQARATNAEQSVGLATSRLGVLPQFLNILTTVLVLSVGSSLIFDDRLSIGQLIAFQGVLVGFTAPLASLVTGADQFQSARALVTQIQDVTHYHPDGLLTPADDTADSGISRSRLAGRIEFRDVTFGYNPSRAPLLSGFSLIVEPGQRVAVVGASGSGKSTVGNLLVGLLQPWQGEILIDDRPLTSWPRDLVTTSIAKVDQTITMFEADVFDNLTLFDRSIPFAWVQDAARDAAILSDISRRAGGFATPVHEGGTNFSGGQTQRLEIARALAMRPSVLVMDEATSALDAEIEERIDTAVRARGITCLIIAHRLSTIRDCDRIIVLSEGQVVGSGTHDHLLTNCAQYVDLVESR